MKYVSTRGNEREYSFEEALFSGFLEDGGIIIPKEIPRINSDTLKEWSRLSFCELVVRVMRLYLTQEEADDQELTGARSYKQYRRHPWCLNVLTLLQTS